MRASRERSRGRRRRVAPRARSRAQTTHRRGPRGRGEGSAPRPTAGSRMRVGHVWLVGAGPGDPGLMTVRGLEALRGADVVVYDRLINPTLLNEAPAEAIRIYAGKLTESHGLPQEDINALLIAHARRVVVWCGSRAAIPSSLDGAARKPRLSRRRRSPSRWSPASVLPSPSPRTPAFRSRTAGSPLRSPS